MKKTFVRLTTILFALSAIMLLSAACGAPPTPTPIPATATAVPPTATAVPPTSMPVPPTATAVPLTATATPPPSPTPTIPPTPTVVPTLAPRVNGAIASLNLITSTVNSEYYALTYWSDGLRVTGFLGRPKSPGQHPALIYNRGGNLEYGALTGIELAPVEAGYVMVASQYRGNAGGEGREQFGGADVNDVLNLIPLLKQLPYVDPDRIGMYGFSRGGMMTYLALKEQSLGGKNDIKVAATCGGLADLFMWNKERTDVAQGVYIPLIGKLPDAAPDLYTARSATYWPELINVPLLLQQGEADERVSVEQSRQLAQKLEQAGKVVKIITYPGDDHSLSKHSLGYPDALTWFQRYLAKPGEDLSFNSHKQSIREVMNWFTAHPQTH